MTKTKDRTPVTLGQLQRIREEILGLLKQVEEFIDRMPTDGAEVTA